jgi:hypothetical protein
VRLESHFNVGAVTRSLGSGGVNLVLTGAGNNIVTTPAVNNAAGIIGGWAIANVPSSAPRGP